MLEKIKDRIEKEVSLLLEKQNLSMEEIIFLINECNRLENLKDKE